MACIGYWKANLVVLPQDWAYEFMLFAQRNPQPCWIGASTDPGDPCPRQLAQDADLRTDLPRYRVFKNGQLIDEPTDIVKYWRDDLVAFLIGVFPNIALSLQNANIRYRHVGSYTSNIPCVPAGRLHGNMAVTCTIFKTSHDAVKAIQVSSRYPDAHGAPVHIGDGAGIGITDFSHPDIVALAHHDNIQHPDMIGRGYELEPGEIALWWGCGVTPQLAAREAKVPLMITHKPAHLFISDKHCEEWSIL
jgi:uncharacterized protein YcsI (UPF0317 family)